MSLVSAGKQPRSGLAEEVKYKKGTTFRLTFQLIRVAAGHTSTSTQFPSSLATDPSRALANSTAPMPKISDKPQHRKCPQGIFGVADQSCHHHRTTTYLLPSQRATILEHLPVLATTRSTSPKLPKSPLHYMCKWGCWAHLFVQFTPMTGSTSAWSTQYDVCIYLCPQP